MAKQRYTIMPLDFGSAEQCIEVGNNLSKAITQAAKHSDDDDGGEPWGVWDSSTERDEGNDEFEVGFVAIAYIGRVYVEAVHRP